MVRLPHDSHTSSNGGGDNTADNDATTEFCCHFWNVPSEKEHRREQAKRNQGAMAIILIYHGFLSHGLYPTVSACVLEMR